MDREKQLIAITKACGGDPETPLQNYLGDLNLMHRAKMILSPAQQKIYENNLDLIVNGPRGIGTWGLLNASASDQAEAFLKTLGLWEDESLKILELLKSAQQKLDEASQIALLLNHDSWEEIREAVECVCAAMVWFPPKEDFQKPTVNSYLDDEPF